MATGLQESRQQTFGGNRHSTGAFRRSSQMEFPVTRLALIASAALAVAACSGEGAEQRAPDQTMAPVNAAQDATAAVVGAGSAALASLNTADFVAAAAQSDMYEIESSKMAVGRSSNAEVKRFAQMMIDNHTKTTAELKTLIAGVEDAVIPATLDQRRQGLLDNLRGASQADFDATYLDQQSNAHREALAVMEGYARGGDNAGLKAFAAKTAPIVKGHLDQVTALDSRGTDESASASATSSTSSQ